MGGVLFCFGVTIRHSVTSYQVKKNLKFSMDCTCVSNTENAEIEEVVGGIKPLSIDP